MFGATSVARIAITTITTRISISVNPARILDRSRRAWRRGIGGRERVSGTGDDCSVSTRGGRRVRGVQLDTKAGETVFIARLTRMTVARKATLTDRRGASFGAVPRLSNTREVCAVCAWI